MKKNILIAILSIAFVCSLSWNYTQAAMAKVMPDPLVIVTTRTQWGGRAGKSKPLRPFYGNIRGYSPRSYIGERADPYDRIDVRRRVIVGIILQRLRSAAGAGRRIFIALA